MKAIVKPPVTSTEPKTQSFQYPSATNPLQFIANKQSFSPGLTAAQFGATAAMQFAQPKYNPIQLLANRHSATIQKTVTPGIPVIQLKWVEAGENMFYYNNLVETEGIEWFYNSLTKKMSFRVNKGPHVQSLAKYSGMELSREKWMEIWQQEVWLDDDRTDDKEQQAHELFLKYFSGGLSEEHLQVFFRELLRLNITAKLTLLGSTSQYQAYYLTLLNPKEKIINQYTIVKTSSQLAEELAKESTAKSGKFMVKDARIIFGRGRSGSVDVDSDSEGSGDESEVVFDTYCNAETRLFGPSAINDVTLDIDNKQAPHFSDGDVTNIDTYKRILNYLYLKKMTCSLILFEYIPETVWTEENAKKAAAGLKILLNVFPSCTLLIAGFCPKSLATALESGGIKYKHLD